MVYVCVSTYSSVQFLEHEEVLLSHDEKMNVQAAAITKGNMTLETMEKEMRDMQLEINEEERQIELKKKEVLLNKRLEGEITTLVIEVGKACMYTNINIQTLADTQTKFKTELYVNSHTVVSH